MASKRTKTRQWVFSTSQDALVAVPKVFLLARRIVERITGAKGSNRFRAGKACSEHDSHGNDKAHYLYPITQRDRKIAFLQAHIANLTQSIIARPEAIKERSQNERLMAVLEEGSKHG